MEISQRKKKILAAVVDEYIRTAEPVGSKTIAQIAGLGCSSATIRNELSELTALGYLEQPHTSAGRIPSPQGYRFYVNELMERQRVSVEEAEAINARLSEKMEQLDKLMSDAGKLAGQLTGYPALSLSAPRAARTDDGQRSLGDAAGEEVLERLRAAALDTMSPIEAMNLLYELKRKLEG